MQKLFSLFTNRIFVVGILLFLQISLLLIGIILLADVFVYLQTILDTISLIVVFWILNRNENPSYKLAWIIPILIFPIFGGLLYLIFGGHRTGRHIKKSMGKISKTTEGLFFQEPEILLEIKEKDLSAYRQVCYIGRGDIDVENPVKSVSPYPIYKNTTSEYLSPGEKKYERLLESIKNAKHFILLEYFIIQEGIMWNTILDILEEKVRDGVEIRILYDDLGCSLKLPATYVETLNKKGIKCRVFNPFRAHILETTFMNNRDHRKIAVIDGHTAFTGGMNLADEYINETHPFGHWKDADIMLTGEAVWTFTVMFFQSWNLSGEFENINYQFYKPHVYRTEPFKSDGYVLPYADSPLDGECVGEMVYLNMIQRATKYLYISTPYLIMDNELTTALILAAKSGVDVRIATPGIYDKEFAKLYTQANYLSLIRGGVKIYEYTPGFLHSKTFVSDDDKATVGTINLDYRSLYLHFECGVFLYQTESVMELKEDYLRMLEYCNPITEETCLSTKWYIRFLRGVMKVFAPLM